MKAWFYRWPEEWSFEFVIWRLQVRVGSHHQAAWWYKTSAGSLGDYVWLFNAGKRARPSQVEGLGSH